MLTPEKSGAQPSTSAQMTFHRTMTTTMGPMQDSLGQSSKEREDRAHSNVRPLVLRQRKLLLIGPKVTLLTVSRTKNVHQPIHPRKKDPKDSGWLEVDEFGWQPTIFPFAAKPGPRDAAAELNSHLPADILERFITDELLQHIREESEYARPDIAETETELLAQLMNPGPGGKNPETVVLATGADLTSGDDLVYLPVE
ncbi:uncharacterized protein LOC144027105 [Festucalex cinctus]